MISKSTILLWPSKSLLSIVMVAAASMALPCKVVAASDLAEEHTVIEADSIIKGKDGEFSLNGNAVVSQGNKQIRAESIWYQQQNERVNIDGGFDYSDSQFKLKGKSARFNLKEETGVILDAEYGLVQEAGNGSAKKIKLKSRTNMVLDNSSYTTCPIGENDWRLVASEIDLNTVNGIGTATHARMEFYDLPVLYLPYYRFPIDERRKTGFLMPQGGYSSDDGLDLRLPLYLNLAPNYDATLTPRVLSKRGMALENEFRYLLVNQAGEVKFDYLPDDKLFKDDRYFIAFKQTGLISENITNSFDLAYVSDKQYFSDLGNSAEISGIDHLNSSIEYIYRSGDWSAGLFMQAYQVLDDDINKQYQRLPSFYLDYNGYKDEWLSEFSFELTNFQHPESDINPTGFRSDIYYKLAYDLSDPGWFVRPSIALRHTHYDLDDSYDDSRTIYSLALDGGLIFERNMHLFGKEILQTFEPRVFFLHTPYIDQQALPVFDSTSNSLGFAQLFSYDRFSGADRVGDTTQVSAAISSNLIDSKDGRNILSLNFGEIFYLEDRLVTLGADQKQTQANSNFVADFRFAPVKGISLNGIVEWDHNHNYTQLEYLAFEYRGDDDKHLGITYLEQKDENALTSVDMATIKGAWRYNSRWRMVGKWNYSLLHQATQETFAGIEYDSGCWAMRLISHRYIEEMDDPNEAEHQILFQIELLGVGGFGQDVDEFMKP